MDGGYGDTEVRLNGWREGGHELRRDGGGRCCLKMLTMERNAMHNRNIRQISNLIGI